MRAGSAASAARGRIGGGRTVHAVLSRFAAACLILLAACSEDGLFGSSDPELTEYQKQLHTGFDMLQWQDYEAAREHFTGMAAQYPLDPTVSLALGVAHHKLANWEAAEENYGIAKSTGLATEVRATIENGVMLDRETTISELAEENLAKLAEDRSAS